MKYLPIRVQALSPLSIRSDHSDTSAGSVEYIPGTTLLGSLAAAHRFLFSDGTRDGEFERLFLNDEVRYPHLYPAVFKNPDKKGKSEEIQFSNYLSIYPLPKTAQTCKRYEGFLYPKRLNKKSHGVRDTLIDWAILKLGQTYGGDSPLAALNAHKSCEACNYKEAMDHFGGYYRREEANPSIMYLAQNDKRLRTHTGIDRDTGIVQEGVLYNREVFAEDSYFWGLVQFPDDGELLSLFSQFLNRKEVAERGLVRVGTGRTRGMGKVGFWLGKDVPPREDPFVLFQQRLHAFNNRLHEQAAYYKVNGWQDTFFFALTLHSPLILTDDLLRYRGTIDETTLTDLLDDYKLPNLKLLYHTASVRRVTGWQELWGLPRVNDYAIDTGSVFLFSCSSLSEDDQRALYTLDEQGAGKRRAEGFGRICISDQFHQEIDLR